MRGMATDMHGIARLLRRRSTDAIEQNRSAMAAMSFDNDPAMAARVKAAIERPNPWPELAARLGVDAGH